MALHFPAAIHVTVVSTGDLGALPEIFPFLKKRLVHNNLYLKILMYKIQSTQSSFLHHV